MSAHELIQTLPIAWVAVVAGAVGLAIGSFLNVVIHRVPRSESIAFPASRCPQCKTPIKPWENIPILSYILLQGRCRTCGWPIKKRYPVVEALGGIVAVTSILVFGVSWAALGGMLLGWHLIALAVIDLETYTVPDHVVVPMAVGGLVIALLRNGWHGVLTALLSAAIMGVFFGLIWVIFRFLRGREGLGTGDITMSVAFALYLQPIMLPLVMLISAFTGLVGALIWSVASKKSLKNKELPFAPALAAGAWLVYMTGQGLLAFLLRASMNLMHAG